MINCKCGIELNDDNWILSRKIKNRKICKSCIKSQNKKRYLKNKNNYLFQQKQQRILVKIKVFEYYGNKCEICFNDDVNCLSLDHVDGNG